MHVERIANSAAKDLLARDAKIRESLADFVFELKNVALESLSRLNSTSLKELVGNLEYFSDLPSQDKGALIERTLPSSLPNGHVKVDFLKRIKSDQGAVIAVEIFTDNRETLGTNLLKLELSNRMQSETNSSIAIGLVLTKDLKSAGWDGAVGTDKEYEYALRQTYRDFLQSPIVLLALDF